jgi:hypothetical protein
MILESFFFTGNSAGYGWQRLKFFVYSSLVHSAVWWLEIWFLYQFEMLEEAFYFKIVLHTLGRFWWGALEPMREAVRDRQDVVGSWLMLAGIVSTVLAVIGAFTDFYFLFLSLAVQIMVRTFHSGVFAIQRVRRPLWSLCLLIIPSFFLPILGWPLTTLMGSLFGGAITVYYTYKQYQTLPSFTFTIPDLKGFWKNGLVYASVGLNTLLISSLFQKEMLPFAFAYPLFRLAFDWTQLFYFDYIKTSRSIPFFLDKLRSLVWKMALLIATSLTLLFIALGVYRSILLGTVFVFAQSLLGIKFVEFFATKRLNFVSFFRWLEIVGKEKGPCRIGRLDLLKSQDHISKLLGKEVLVTCLGNQSILWFEKDVDMTLERLCSIGGGVIQQYRKTETQEDGKNAIEAAIACTILERSGNLTLEEIKKQFLETTKEYGMLLDPHTQTNRTYRSAVKYLQFLKPSSDRQNMEITALIHPLEKKELLFGITKQSPVRVRREWRKKLLQINQQLYIQAL